MEEIHKENGDILDKYVLKMKRVSTGGEEEMRNLCKKIGLIGFGKEKCRVWIGKL